MATAKQKRKSSRTTLPPKAPPLAALARKAAANLLAQKRRVVFAESCTAGLISATLSLVPGVSEVHCGGAIVYRNATKQEYLGISEQLLRNPGPVSEPVASEMAARVLASTPEADVAFSVTGHLGPDAPAKLDGVVFIGMATRCGDHLHVNCQKLRLAREANRALRQKLVVGQVLQWLGQIDFSHDHH